MESYKLKNAVIMIMSFLGVLFFGYTWLSTSYNDVSNYDYLRNNFGQFAFCSFTMFFIYHFLKNLKKERLFLTIIIISFVAIVTIYIVNNVFLWPSAIVLFISLLFFLVRKYLWKNK
ncbi:hypothetical protein [Chryseobacterium gleum]|uniref:hypothetical protein n=1 Tax=Chryseobacterium gleum TaxID=250 RepID=UPI00289FF464|nr:hypothetical protein [Chryseobacterium gleum]